MDTLKPIEVLPEHLNAYVVQQDYSLYTPRDHAAWRYIMKVSAHYFETHAHAAYRAGLKETGISSDRIPRIEEMDAAMRKFGWRAVAVSGFIPPAVFMELQSLGVLPIACDMRQFEHLAYTPAPDIVHEAAGHAPILADEGYRTFVRRFGQIARKAITTSDDMEMYEAIRHLSVVKEESTTSARDLADAQHRLESAKASIEYVSENAYLSRLYWWTAEYGLIGSIHDPDGPRIYGAGLLSSAGEGQSCLGDAVHKIPLTLDCISTSYDITRPQPQLFVTPNFEHVLNVLEAYADTMAFRRGGAEGLTKAKQARSVVTVEVETGAAVSGCLTDFRVFGAKGLPSFVKFSGPCQITDRGTELRGQGIHTHPDGFSCPIGRVRLQGQWTSPAELTHGDLEMLGFKNGLPGTLEYESGIVLTGTILEVSRRDEKLLLMRMQNTRVALGTETLYEPAWGPFDLLCGGVVSSVYGGPADCEKYIKDTNTLPEIKLRPKTNLTDRNKAIQTAYESMNNLRRERPATSDITAKHLDTLQSLLPLLARYPEDWLIRYEVLEFCRSRRAPQDLKPQFEWIATNMQNELERAKPTMPLSANSSIDTYALSIVIQSGLKALETEAKS